MRVSLSNFVPAPWGRGLIFRLPDPYWGRSFHWAAMENEVCLVQLKYLFYLIAVKAMIPLWIHVPSSWCEGQEDVKALRLKGVPQAKHSGIQRWQTRGQEWALDVGKDVKIPCLYFKLHSGASLLRWDLIVQVLPWQESWGNLWPWDNSTDSLKGHTFISNFQSIGPVYVYNVLVMYFLLRNA